MFSDRKVILVETIERLKSLEVVFESVGGKTKKSEKMVIFTQTQFLKNQFFLCNAKTSKHLTFLPNINIKIVHALIYGNIF